jgi:hypothetical protein
MMTMMMIIIIRRKRFTCRINTVRKQTHSNNYYLPLFHRINGYANAPWCYDVCTLPLLLNVQFLHLQPVFTNTENIPSNWNFITSLTALLSP